MAIEIETLIYRDRSKILFAIIGCIAFVAIGVWLLTISNSEIVTSKGFRLFFNSPAFAKGSGGAAIIVFGSLLIFLARKLFDTKPALVLTLNGITDNAGLNAAGFIPWSEIAGYDVFEMSGQKTLVVFVNDPDKYASLGNPITRKLNEWNANMVGSPISISTATLDIDMTELIQVFEKYHFNFQSNNAISATDPSPVL